MTARDVIERHLNQKAGLVLTSEANADAILAALDAAGFAVVLKNQTAAFLADNVSDEMVKAASNVWKNDQSSGSFEELLQFVIAAALRQAASTEEK